MSTSTFNEGKPLNKPPGNQNYSTRDKNDFRNRTWRKTSQGEPRNANRNWKSPKQSYGKAGKFKKNQHLPPTKSKLEDLMKNEEYSHLLNSSKLTVFDWDTTIVLRNLPAQVEAVKKTVSKYLTDISVTKYCPIKKTFKGTAHVTLALVLKYKTDIEKAITRLHNLKVGDYRIIVSPFVKPHGFTTNPFSACIQNFPSDATEKDLSEVLNDCGTLSSLDVNYSETGAVQKVLVNLSDSSNLSSLLHQDGVEVKSSCLEIFPIKPNTSVIVGNVHPKVSQNKIQKIFDDATLVQKKSNMVYQVFLKDEDSVKMALTKDGECVKGSAISVRPWTKEQSKTYKVFVHVTGNKDGEADKFDMNKCMQQCGKLCSISPVNSNSAFVVLFESQEGQNAALQLNGSVMYGKTLKVTRKRPLSGGSGITPTTGNRDNANDRSNFTASSKKNHVYFD